MRDLSTSTPSMQSLERLAQLSNLNEQHLRAAQARVDQGEAAPLERGLLQVEFSRLQTDRLRLEGDLNRALVELKGLSGLSLDADILLDSELTRQTPDVPITVAIERAFAAGQT